MKVGLPRGLLYHSYEPFLRTFFEAPFKLFAAELEEAWRRGADTVVMPSSRGPCRLGEFCELLKVLLDRRGCHYE